jgi:hypothetical protein
MQVAEAVHRYGKPLGVNALAVYGGSSMEMQIRALEGMERDDVLEALHDWFRRDLALDDEALMRLVMSGKWHARKAGRDVENIDVADQKPAPELVS